MSLRALQGQTSVISVCPAHAEQVLLILGSIPTPAPTGLIESAIIDSNRRGEVEVMLAGCVWEGVLGWVESGYTVYVCEIVKQKDFF